MENKRITNTLFKRVTCCVYETFEINEINGILFQKGSSFNTHCIHDLLINYRIETNLLTHARYTNERLFEQLGTVFLPFRSVPRAFVQLTLACNPSKKLQSFATEERFNYHQCEFRKDYTRKPINTSI